MNAIEHDEFHRGWAAVAAHLPRPRAVLSVSAHCETQDAQVTAAALPATIHDFHGFPQALFDVRDPERVGLDPRRGLDHGAWNVPIAMYPAADLRWSSSAWIRAGPGRTITRSPGNSRPCGTRGCWSSPAGTSCATW